MRTSTYLLLALSTITLAQPTLQSREPAKDDQYDWAPSLEKYYKAVGKHVADIRDTKNSLTSIPCDLTKAVQPIAPTPLPPPTDRTLTHVAIGRGTQNYTCKGKAATDAPAATGAVASLYNASCFASSFPDLLALGPTAALQFPYPTSDKASLPPANLGISGKHYFVDSTTPTFDLDTKAAQLGCVLTRKVTGTPAPPLTAGQAPIGYGNVAWLLLESKAGTTGTIQLIYRLNTAGGSPPPTCADQPEVFQQDYSAEYWFYS
ncbi:hypothetical protein MMC16_005350 [Acarospora aff. strigata]|nr:hypothetical protein [Acarospora aff. strigata]